MFGIHPYSVRQGINRQALVLHLRHRGYSQQAIDFFLQENSQIETIEQFDALTVTNPEYLSYMNCYGYQTSSLVGLVPQELQLDRDLLLHCTLDVPQELATMKNLVCKVCLEVLIEPSEALCCSNLFCRSCISPLQCCPCCRSCGLTFVKNVPITRLVNDLPVKCKHCSSSTTIGEFVDHFKTCIRRPLRCNYCNRDFSRQDALKHLESHSENVLSDCFS
ncbi:hypothetical protein RCL1_002757 [Eukaryota sp. TZLM3-RCL]